MDGWGWHTRRAGALPGPTPTVTANAVAVAGHSVEPRAALGRVEGSEIRGAVTAESARLAGKVTGSITARELVILKTARIEGDVHYDALTIEQGAAVDGRFAPNAPASLAVVAAVDAKAAE